MDDAPQIAVDDRAAWRAWLAAHHARARSVWLVIPRKGHGTLTAIAASEEALCFGWIDSRPRKLDATRSLLLMSPRTPGSAWAGVNKARVKRLRAEGRMAAPGEAAIARAVADGSWERLDGAIALEEPLDMRAALDAAPGAWAAWRAFPPSHRRANLEWLAQAKRAETRAARVAEIAAKPAKGERANSWKRP